MSAWGFIWQPPFLKSSQRHLSSPMPTFTSSLSFFIYLTVSLTHSFIEHAYSLSQNALFCSCTLRLANRMMAGIVGIMLYHFSLTSSTRRRPRAWLLWLPLSQGKYQFVNELDCFYHSLSGVTVIGLMTAPPIPIGHQCRLSSVRTDLASKPDMCLQPFVWDLLNNYPLVWCDMKWSALLITPCVFYWRLKTQHKVTTMHRTNEQQTQTTLKGCGALMAPPALDFLWRDWNRMEFETF